MNTNSKNPFRKFFLGIMILGISLTTFGPSSLISARALEVGINNPAGIAQPKEVSFSLDAVDITVQATSIPSIDVVASEPRATSQVATSVSWKPYREISITAIPFATKPATESVPVASHGLRAAYIKALRNYRIKQGGKVTNSRVATLFGQKVSGIHTLVNLFIDGPVQKPVVIDEWVVEAGNRLWIVRTSEEQSKNTISAQTGNLSKNLIISSSDLSHPTTLYSYQTDNPVTDLSQSILAANLPMPSWWNGDCDTNNYSKAPENPQHIAAYPLGASYLGLKACGPRPYYDSAPDVLVRFYSGSWGEFEWECVELSMRYLYLMYGIPPYQANGSQVVWNYSGGQLVKIPNGTLGIAPQPGDVLSYGSTSTWGHTSVVALSNINGNGYGTIDVIEQNASSSGTSRLLVSNWVVSAFSPISGWLHEGNIASFQSDGDYDGSVLEANAHTGIGGSLNSTDQVFLFGDDALNRQYRSILSFDTSNLPDNAVVTFVVLKIMQQFHFVNMMYPSGGVGDPIPPLGVITWDIKKGYFGSAVELEVGDFQAASNCAMCGNFGSTLIGGWFTATIGSSVYPYINLTGTTQFRTWFSEDSNDNNSTDILNVFSGDASDNTTRPVLMVNYYLP